MPFPACIVGAIALILAAPLLADPQLAAGARLRSDPARGMPPTETAPAGFTRAGSRTYPIDSPTGAFVRLIAGSGLTRGRVAAYMSDRRPPPPLSSR